MSTAAESGGRGAPKRGRPARRTPAEPARRDRAGGAVRTADVMTEKAWQSRVVDYAALKRWHQYHTHDSRRSPAGFPDLVLVRERVVFVELKSARGRLTGEQRRWRDLLVRAGAEWHCWRPEDWGRVMEALR